ERPGVDRTDPDPPLTWSVRARDEAAAARALARFETADLTPAPIVPPPAARGRLLEVPDRGAHEAATARALRFIAAGDVYQVNLAGRFRVASEIAPSELYLRMRSVQPVAHGAFFAPGAPGAPGVPDGSRDPGSDDALAVLVLSPERFLRIAGDSIETRPIKGT